MNARKTKLMCLGLMLTALLGLSRQAWADGGVLVFGGTGRLGSEVVKALVEAGEAVTVFARPSSDRGLLEGLSVDYVIGDVLEGDQVEAAFRSAGFRSAVDALARRSAGPSFYDLSQRHIARWAKETGVKQVILHGSVGAGDSRWVYPPERWDRMAETLTAKDTGERHLIGSGVNYTIIRNFTLLPHGTPPTGNAELLSDQRTTGMITREDLAGFTVQCLENPACQNRIFHAVDYSATDPRRR